MLDERSGERFRWRSQTRAFKLRETGNYAYYRIEFSGGGATLGEIELLEPAAADTVAAGDRRSSAVAASRARRSRSASSDQPRRDAPASGTLTRPLRRTGWTVTPASASFGPIASGAVDRPIDAEGCRAGRHGARQLPGPAGAELEPAATCATARWSRDRRHDRVHAGHGRGGAVAVRRRRLAARRRHLRRPGTLRRRQHPRHVPVRAARPT